FALRVIGEPVGDQLVGRLAGGGGHDLARRGIGLDYRRRLARSRCAKQRAIAEGAGRPDDRKPKYGGDGQNADAPAWRRGIVVDILSLGGMMHLVLLIGVGLVAACRRVLIIVRLAAGAIEVVGRGRIGIRLTRAISRSI